MKASLLLVLWERGSRSNTLAGEGESRGREAESSVALWMSKCLTTVLKLKPAESSCDRKMPLRGMKAFCEKSHLKDKSPLQPVNGAS